MNPERMPRRAIDLHRRKNLLNRQGLSDAFQTGSDAASATTESKAQVTTSKAAAATTSTKAAVTTTSKASVTSTSTSTSTSATSVTSAVTSTSSSTTSLSKTSSSTTTSSSSSATSTSTSSKVSTTSATTSTSETFRSLSSASHVSTVIAQASVSASTSSATGVASSAVSTGAIVGIVGGCIVGVAVISFVVAFLVRRWRNKGLAKEEFDAAQFRHSAVLIDDDNTFTPGPFSSDNYRPRPPTMIQRHLNNTGIASYGNYGAGTIQYGIEPTGQYSMYPQPPIHSSQQFYGGDMYASAGYAAEGQMHDPVMNPGAYQPPAISIVQNQQPAQEMNRAPTVPGALGHSDVSNAAPRIPAPPSQAHISERDLSSTKPRPDTVYTTVYDPDDAYGGM